MTAGRRSLAGALALFLAVASVSPAAAGTGQSPADIGSWELLSDPLPRTPIHAALMRNGRVWLASGSGLDPEAFEAGDFPSYVWDPLNELLTTVDAPWDVFCAGHSFLADGRLLLAGGTAQYKTALSARDWKGSHKAYTFNPLTEQYEALPQMAGGRWYPTLVTLGNGRVYAIAGIDSTGHAMNTVPEVYYPGKRQWRSRPEMPPWPAYPALLLTRDGRLLFSGGNVDPPLDVPPGLINVGTSAVTPVPGLSLPNSRDQSATVLLPPAQLQRVAIIGGASAAGPGIDHVDIVDLRDQHPAFEPAASLNFPRVHLSAVLLPDRSVLVTGGGQNIERDPVLEAELYDPVADEWRVLAAGSVPRLYHSFALLLPDGRVLVGGSQPGGIGGPAETRLEVYSPPYLFRGTRPSITASPENVGYGGDVRISTTSSTPIKWVSLIRPSAVTHTTDTEQRLVNVPFRRIRSGRFELTIPSNRNIAPPGWYMLFVSDSAGIPSIARWVHLS